MMTRLTSWVILIVCNLFGSFRSGSSCLFNLIIIYFLSCAFLIFFLDLCSTSSKCLILGLFIMVLGFFIMAIGKLFFNNAFTKQLSMFLSAKKQSRFVSLRFLNCTLFRIIPLWCFVEILGRANFFITFRCNTRTLKDLNLLMRILPALYCLCYLKLKDLKN